MVRLERDIAWRMTRRWPSPRPGGRPSRDRARICSQWWASPPTAPKRRLLWLESWRLSESMRSLSFRPITTNPVRSKSGSVGPNCSPPPLPIRHWLTITIREGSEASAVSSSPFVQLSDSTATYSRYHWCCRWRTKTDPTINRSQGLKIRLLPRLLTDQ